MIPLFMIDNAFAEQHDKGLDINLEILAIIAGFSGIGTLGWGIYQYRQVRLDKRKEVFLEITKEFDTSVEFLPAKKILDAWAVAYSAEKGLRPSVKGQFSINNIDWILSKGYNHRMALEKKYEKDFQGLKSDELWSIVSCHVSSVRSPRCWFPRSSLPAAAARAAARRLGS